MKPDQSGAPLRSAFAVHDEGRIFRAERDQHITEYPKTVYGDLSVSHPATVVNRVINQARSLSITTTAFRILASLVGCATVAGTWLGGTPLHGAAHICNFFAIPAAWTIPAAAWIAERAEPIGFLATLMVALGLFATPRPRQLSRDLGEALEWRGPSTTVLALALVMQSDYLGRSLVTLVPLAAFGIWAAGRSGLAGDSRPGRVGVAFIGLVLAVLFVPLYVFGWLYGREARNTNHEP
ncbi:hypothetical protein ACFY12_25185 [Streptomyces sp. NPDC001339]|uniref:hypothetical protein n=1 Tax=Streptomyces sp. NPDC001339 TaxID=3364563 RepID=UPI00369A7309